MFKMDYYTVVEKVHIVKWYYQDSLLWQIVELFTVATENRGTPFLKAAANDKKLWTCSVYVFL